MLRRPQDVHASDDQPPRLAGYRKSAEEYAARYERALARGKDAAACDALWGLVARGTESVGWCEGALRSGDDLRISDAAGVCLWIGPPSTLIETLRSLVETLPDSEGRDSAAAALPAEVRAEMTREEDDAAPDIAPGDNLLECTIVWYVEAPLERVVADHEQRPARQDASEPATRHSAPLIELGPLLEWSAETPWRRPYLMVSAGDRWTAVFSRTADHSWVDSFSRRLDTRVLRTSCSSEDPYPGVAFWLTLPGGKEWRSIQVGKDDSGWFWHLRGSEQAFEEPERYQERLKAKRFDVQMLDRYCLALRIDRNNPDFYGPDAVLFVDGSPDRPRRRRRWWR
ncbi:hypothetical protein OM076_00945 [Solirubrobacter ginsenosidimutans]|uniref:Uncharacterized protein n=1 Tax=Solirubrobacter ginsenosidimutans TaxID=490573 RepID=A0A9X3MMG9_9ACTN|nr:hypothetical protein [Solirubrobacter ginsenosidimutans]MDA0158815.1 hypothetical protein [Solirubrobacter ginsenosidimutans]